MKKIVIASMLIIVLASTVKAQQNTPVIDAREGAQRGRIQQGVANDEVTRTEAVRLRSEQRRIHRTERRAKRDGEVTRQEKARIERKQNRASRDIRRQKNDAQRRPVTH